MKQVAREMKHNKDLRDGIKHLEMLKHRWGARVFDDGIFSVDPDSKEIDPDTPMLTRMPRKAAGGPRNFVISPVLCTEGSSRTELSSVHVLTEGKYKDPKFVHAPVLCVERPGAKSEHLEVLAEGQPVVVEIPSETGPTMNNLTVEKGVNKGGASEIQGDGNEERNAKATQEEMEQFDNLVLAHETDDEDCTVRGGSSDCIYMSLSVGTAILNGRNYLFTKVLCELEKQ